MLRSWSAQAMPPTTIVVSGSMQQVLIAAAANTCELISAKATVADPSLIPVMPIRCGSIAPVASAFDTPTSTAESRLLRSAQSFWFAALIAFQSFRLVSAAAAKVGRSMLSTAKPRWARRKMGYSSPVPPRRKPRLLYCTTISGSRSPVR